MIRRILDPNPVTRITMDEIKADEWFRKDYNPPNTDDDDENVHANGMAFSVHEMVWILNMYIYIYSVTCLIVIVKLNLFSGVQSLNEESPGSPTPINAFELIGMSSSLDLSGFFEKEVLKNESVHFF